MARYYTIALLLAATALAQVGHTLQGKVTLPDGSAPPHPVKITLTFNGVRIHETFTDMSGHFSFSGLGRGTYVLTAEGDGQTFETTSVYTEIFTIGNAPRIYTQNIHLRPQKPEKLNPAGVISAEQIDPNAPEKALKEYKRGIKSANDGDPKKAIKHLQEAIRVHPEFYLAYAAMAEQYSKLQQYEDAAAAYQKAIQISPNRAEAYLGMGALLIKQKKYEEAVAPLRRTIELEKRSHVPYLLLGLAQMMIGELDAAEENLQRAYKIGKPPLAHIYLANIYELRGQLQKAIAELEAFLRENPQSPNSSQVSQALEKLRRRAASN
jgi:Tfp pilus assembly protein PilF